MEALAHSARNGFPAQSYRAHADGVYRKAIGYASEAERYADCSVGLLRETISRSALLHDLGKLHKENQAVLRGENNAAHLPINHVDAGTALLLKQDDLYAALNVYAHHRGLPDLSSEKIRGVHIFRDARPAVRSRVDTELKSLLAQHRALVPDYFEGNVCEYGGDLSVFLRMLLSCLADADHSDTAISHGQTSDNHELPLLRAEERLNALNEYVSGLGGADERSVLRREMYQACRDRVVQGNFTACDSPVGSGKTTAVMAHLLRQAAERKARRVFVVLPYTSIIRQSVDVYRRALVLPGETPEEVVAELHCRADFQDWDTRYLTSLWRAPIVVTTAVAFFETLASNRPASLRRLHELPGSVVFVDESHNALPLRLLPLAWRWMNVLAKEWGCYWTLASGSLVRFWQLKSLDSLELPHPIVGELTDASLTERLMRYEKNRISFRYISDPLSRDELLSLVQNVPGPRLLILNTVQSAAVLAEQLYRTAGRDQVEHLSTALSASDREVVIQRVQRRLQDVTDQDWTLVATSCVEAGVDFSFRTGFREMSSLLSLLQTAGRVNRNGRDNHAEMWSFSMQDDPLLTRNPVLKTAITVLEGFFAQGAAISPELSTQAMEQEIVQDDSCLSSIKELMSHEEEMAFETIEKRFEAIESNTVTTVADRTLCQLIRSGKSNWQQLQKKAFSIRRDKVKDWALEEIASGVYQWTLRYDSFLGYMRGVLDVEVAKNDMLIL